MKAVYNNRICAVLEAGYDLTLSDKGQQVTVSFGDAQLIIDPTDEQVAGADNLDEWYGLDDEGTKDLAAMLRGELSAETWQTRKAARR